MVKPSVAVSFDDLDGMIGILHKQQEHLADLAWYVNHVCADTSGMTNLMSLLVGSVQRVAGDCLNPLTRSDTGIGQTAADLGTAKDLFGQTDYDSAVDLSSLFQNYIPGRQIFHEFADSSAVLSHGSYTEVWNATPNPSYTNPGWDTAIQNRANGLSGRYQQYWSVLVYQGGDLLDKIIKPVIGDYTTLNALHEAYQNLGTSTYEIAANLRRGTYAIAPKWKGYFAENFEYLMLCWHEGVGGLGDLYQLVGDAYNTLYGEVVGLLNRALSAIDDLIGRFFPRLDEIFDRNPGSWQEVVNCGPGYAVANKLISEGDMKEALRRMQDVVEQVAKVKKEIDEIEAKYKNAKAKFQQIWDGVGTVRQKGVGGAVSGLAEKQYNKYAVDFEAHDGKYERESWDPRYGVWRYAMLPI
jgi:uncharacterized protein YukE